METPKAGTKRLLQHDRGHGGGKLGRSWATLANTPFRYFKHFEYEGGTASPFIVHWAAGIADKGKLRPQMGHLIDMMPTLVDLAHATYPTELAGHKILPEEGISLVPAFNSDAPLSRPNPIFYEHEGNKAINDGQWKLVANFDKNWELYDYFADRSEILSKNQAAARTDVVKRLSDQWTAWAKRVGVSEVIPGYTRNGHKGNDKADEAMPQD